MTFSDASLTVLGGCICDSDRKMLQAAVLRLPDGVEFEAKQWNLRGWDPRARSLSLRFDQYTNLELVSAVKFCILAKRETDRIGGLYGKAIWNELQVLDRCVAGKSLAEIDVRDFKAAEMFVVEHVSRSAAKRAIAYLQDFGAWLSSTFGNETTFTPSVAEYFAHGRHGTEAQREQKLVPTECIEMIVRLANDESLPPRDQYFLNALMLCVACGFRLGELATLPEDCYVETGPDTFGIRYFPEKESTAPVKPIPPPLVAAIKTNIERLKEFTKDGRAIARKYRGNTTSLNWRKIYSDFSTLELFFRAWCHEWTLDLNHRLVNPDAAWWNSRRQWIDAIAILEESGSQLAAAKSIGASRQTFTQLLNQQLSSIDGKVFSRTPRGPSRVDWRQDHRFLSAGKFEDHTGRLLTTRVRKRLIPILRIAQECQLNNEVFEAEEIDPGYRDTFLHRDDPVLSDTRVDAPRALLYASESLLVLPRYWLSDRFETSSTEYLAFSDTLLSLWMNGRCDSARTSKSPRERSFFERYDIIDPRTNQPLEMTLHDIRHWLQTLLEEGGASQEAIRLIMARNSVQHNAVYDQTSAATRIGRIKADVRARRTHGLLQRNYDSLLAERGDVEAEAYLEAKMGSMTNMTHGGCLLNMHTQSCQNNLGCFNGQDGPCESLFVDPSDAETSVELNRLRREYRVLRANIHPQSPQWTHADNVVQNISAILSGKRS